MNQLQLILCKLDMECYLQRLLDNGFDTWEVLKDITESDMHEIGLKLGHRRKLQREIATSRGWPPNAPLEQTGQCCGAQQKRQEPKVFGNQASAPIAPRSDYFGSTMPSPLNIDSTFI
ncbi:hypothetical protein ACMFMG_010560 [Clarireedia jacksonii]